MGKQIKTTKRTTTNTVAKLAEGIRARPLAEVQNLAKHSASEKVQAVAEAELTRRAALAAVLKPAVKAASKAAQEKAAAKLKAAKRIPSRGDHVRAAKAEKLMAGLSAAMGEVLAATKAKPAAKTTATRPLAQLMHERVRGTAAQQEAAGVELAALKAVRGPVKARKAKLAPVATNAAKDEGALAAIESGKAPTGKAAYTVRGSYLSYLAAAKGDGLSASYQDGLVRSVGEFVSWAEASGYQLAAKLDSAALLAYRQRAKLTPSGTPRAEATQRKELDRVKRFLLWLPSEERPRIGDEAVKAALTVRAPKAA